MKIGYNCMLIKNPSSNITFYSANSYYSTNLVLCKGPGVSCFAFFLNIHGLMLHSGGSYDQSKDKQTCQAPWEESPRKFLPSYMHACMHSSMLTLKHYYTITTTLLRDTSLIDKFCFILLSTTNCCLRAAASRVRNGTTLLLLIMFLHLLLRVASKKDLSVLFSYISCHRYEASINHSSIWWQSHNLSMLSLQPWSISGHVYIKLG